VDHAAAWTEHASTICEERRIISNMLDDGAGYDEIGRGVAKRKPIRCGIGNYFVIEQTVAAEFFFRKVQRNDQLPGRSIEIVQKRALLAAADVEHNLTGTAIDQFSGLILVERLYVALELGRQAILGGFAQPLVGSDETRKQGTGIQP
jgi:hypothetical protein